jgi:hypothetical protein
VGAEAGGLTVGYPRKVYKYPRKPPPVDPRTHVEARIAFFALVGPQTSTAPCWLWQGEVQPTNGYSKFKYRGHSFVGYRFSYLSIVGPVPAGMTIRHVCDDRRCVNPRHLVLGTKADNTRDIYVTKRALAAVAAAQGAKGDGHETTIETRALRSSPGRSAFRTERIGTVAP